MTHDCIRGIMELRQEIKPSLRQEQWVKLQMMQFLKVLQLSQLELRDAIQLELEKNPVLEIKEEKKEDVGEGMNEENTKEEDENIAAAIAENGSEGESVPRIDKEKIRKSTAEIIEATASRDITLHDYLLEQFFLKERDFLESKIGEFLIGNIDEKGYLKIGSKEVSLALDVEESRVEDVIKIIQGLDPLGVGARNLGECLTIQAKDLNLSEQDLEIIRNIAGDHLEDLARGRFSKIAKSLNTSEEKIRELDSQIKKLNPYPGQTFSDKEASRVMPEIIVRRNEGKYEIAMDDTKMPRLWLNPLYLRMIQEKDNNAKAYLREKIDSARLFIKSIGQRKELVYKISNLIVQMQRDFFDKGINYLKPLTLEEVARITEVHPSTAGRAIANKYMQTPKGIFPMKFFFSVSVNDDLDISSRSIKDRIHALIEKEDKLKPLSDNDIMEGLKREGINISRRTVAKYREAINIPSTFKRRS